MGFNAKKPSLGGHERSAVLKLGDLLKAGETSIARPKTYVDSDDSLWYCTQKVIGQVLMAPDKVIRTRRGYTYQRVVDGPDGRVCVAVETNPTGKKDVATDLGQKVTTVYPDSGANVRQVNTDGSITDLPLKGGNE